METLSLADLARGLHPSSSSHKVVAVLQAYLDESGTHAQSPVVMIGGFVASADLWGLIETDWNGILANIGVPYFHASECEAGDGIYWSIPRELRDALFVGLSKVIAKHHPIAVYTAVTRQQIVELKARGVDLFDDPYHACLEFCLQHLSQWAQGEGGKEPIALMLAEQDEYESGARSFYDLYRRNPRWGKEFASLAFGRAKKFAALQAADLIVYEKTRHEIARRKDPNAPIRPAIQIMADADVRAIDFPYDLTILKEVIGDTTLVSLPEQSS